MPLENIGGYMVKKFKLVKVDHQYCDYLRQFDSKVCYNRGSKELRPYIGILFEINNLEYFAPLSSPKEKHKTMPNQLDIIKINDGKYGIINFNNMIPVQKEYYELLNFNDIKDEKYKYLLQLQLNWLNHHAKMIKDKAFFLYNKYKSGALSSSIMNRCCNFILLEEKSKAYDNVVKTDI